MNGNLETATKPAFRSVPQYVQTFGPDVAEVCELAGFAPDADQRMMLDGIFGVDEHGKSVAFETAVIACRQNIKTGLFKQCVLGWLFATNVRLIVWSAHEFATSSEAFRDIDELIASDKSFRRKIKSVITGNGKESIELVSGARLIFKTRTKGGGRGLTGSKVILDEGFALQPMHMGALLPTMSTQPDPQVLYGSSAGLAESGVLRGVRDRGRAGGDPSLAYFEWCAPDPAEVCELGELCPHTLNTEGCGCDDPANWAKANPALGRRIEVSFIAKERRALPPEEFGRERMGWWDEPVERTAPLTVDKWNERVDLESEMLDPVAFGFDVSPGHKSAAISVTGDREDGKGHGETIEHENGTHWVVKRLVELAQKWNPCAVVLDPAGPAGAFVKELNKRGFVDEPREGQWKLVLTGAREYAQACGSLVKDVNDDLFKHRGQRSLNQAVEGLRIRPLADAYAWSRKDSTVDISPLVALTMARIGFATHGFDAPPPEPFSLFGRN